MVPHQESLALHQPIKECLGSSDTIMTVGLHSAHARLLRFDPSSTIRDVCLSRSASSSRFLASLSSSSTNSFNSGAPDVLPRNEAVHEKMLSPWEPCYSKYILLAIASV
jgi:hypothetical protein